MGDSTVGMFTTNTPEAVAEAAYEGFQSGETVVIPSRAMRVVSVLGQILPRSVVRRVAGWVNSGR
jgi:short-subunit dehydrogenase